MGRLTFTLLCLAVLPAALLSACAAPAGQAAAPAAPAGSAPTGRPSSPTVRAEFQPACGQPGARVTVLAVPVIVAHAACDLVGVQLTYGLASAVVPGHGKVEGHVETFVATTAPLSIVITVADGTGDVTVTG